MSAGERPYRSVPVFIGSVPVGGDYPIRLQSMTNTDTLDTEASAAQCIRIIEAGADYVRLTAQGVREAENLANIRERLRKAGFQTPLIADIHFNPAAAEVAAAIVEKVRINPGNYADKRTSGGRVLSSREYDEELERIHERVLPLINICRANGTAVRIGVNHGSLSGRILDRYGNTPLGMVVSAMEFLKIFRSDNFGRIVVSMKSSDTEVMTEATRLLVKMMSEEGVVYPVHLGVTEAGEGEDGRVRSAAGIGALLAEGIGDTIRVSLTEDPEKEIPVAKKLIEFMPRGIAGKREYPLPAFKTRPVMPDPFRKINGPLVLINMSRRGILATNDYLEAGYKTVKPTEPVIKADGAADLIIASQVPETVPPAVMLAVPYKIWMQNKNRGNVFPLFSPETWPGNDVISPVLNVILAGEGTKAEKLRASESGRTLLIFSWDADKNRFAPDSFFRRSEKENLNFNVILNPVFRGRIIEDLQIEAPALLGGYLNNRLVRGIMITCPEATEEELTRLSFSILQCTGQRITRTIYISCPTCGRTKFDLREAVSRVKDRTSHLKGLKIAVMGCVVNGPGEMAGADWGYVGAGKGKVHIYRGTEPVLKNVDEGKAVDELLRLIGEDQASR